MHESRMTKTEYQNVQQDPAQAFGIWHLAFGMRTWISFGLLVFLALPSVAQAANVTAQQVLKAAAEGQQAGICSSNSQKSGSDCTKTVTTCEASAWTKYIDGRYEYKGGAIVTKDGQKGPFDALEYLQADWSTNKVTPPGPIQAGTCFCECQTGDTDPACQGKPAGSPFKVGEALTEDICEAQCGVHPIAKKCAGTLPPLATTGGSSGSVDSANDSALCFTSADCSAQDGIFEAYASCGSKGRCYAKEPAVHLGVPLGSVTDIQGFSGYVVAGYRYMISIVAVASAIMFTYGAFLYLIGSALPSLKRGREIMVDAVIGMILVLGATGILRTINPATTKLNALKVYMVNTVQFVHTTMCSDLEGANKLAEAGTRPNLKEVDKIPATAYTVAPKQATCGKSYFIQNAVGGACDGSLCPGQGEACVSCADGLAKDCNGKQSDARVCDRLTFGGTIDYRDGKYPTGLDLLAVCNYAQNTDPSVVNGNIALIKGSVKPTIVGRAASTQTTTDKNDVGRAGYRFEFTELDVAEAVQDCPKGGGLRGFVLGLVYKQAGSSAGVNVDDVAVLSKHNCGSGRFDGYENGSVSDTSDEAAAIACGVKQGKFFDTPGTYWTKQDMDAAAQGVSPITCNFDLSKVNAPADPAGKFCPQAPVPAGSTGSAGSDAGTPDLQGGINSLN